MDGRFSREYIEKLAHKFANGTLTQQEQADFEAWYTSHNDEQFEHTDAGNPDRAMQRMYRGVRRNIHPGSTRRITHWLPYAAAMILALSVGFFFWEKAQLTDRELTKEQELAAAEILPGGNRATLTLSDGRTVDLDSAQTGIIIRDGNINYDDGTTVEAPIHHSSSITHHSLTTPKGGTYQVTLPDGSKVWLNAGSTLKYPSRFTAGERLVEVAGEGYFSVVRDESKPFKVVSRGQQIEVLGTEFNISAYADESSTRTTLVNGSVRVAPTAGSPVPIRPGEQATVRGAQLDVRQVDIANATAWKSGRFSFDSKSFDQIMNEMARWYNLTVEYEGGIPSDRFIGDAFRTDKLSTVLRFLESSHIKYRLEGNTLIIINSVKEER